MPISKPSEGRRNDSRAKPRGGVFLGGPLSAMLLSLCFFEHSGILERVIPWFGLLPLFISLERHRYSLKWRLLHGLFFGLITCCWQLQTADGEFFTPSAALLETAVAILLVTGSWMLFCSTGGWFFRHPSPLAVLPGLAVLWTGIELLRTEWIPMAMPWFQLGQAIKPANPEACSAAVVGLSGLGFIMCLVNCAFYLTLKNKRGRVQLACALSGALAVIGMLVAGRDHAAPSTPSATTIIGVVQTAGEDNGKHLELAKQLSGSKPQLILFPADSFLVEADRQEWLEEDLRALSRKEKVPVVVGIANKPGGSGDRDTAKGPGILHIGADGEIVARLKRGANNEEALLFEIGDTKAALVSDSVHHSAIRMRSLAARGARLFLIAGNNETNSQGVYGHLRSRLEAFRAREAGAWTCRATRGGISAICNDRGSIVAQAPRGQAWATVNTIPAPPLNRAPSHFAAWGWALGPACLLLLAILLLTELYRHSRSK